MTRSYRAAVLAALMLLAAGGPAQAQIWSLLGSVSQRFEADDNIDVVPDPDGLVFGSRTTLGLTLGAQTRRTNWSLQTGTTIGAFVGETEGTDLNAVNPSLAGSVVYSGQRFGARGNFGFSRQSTSFLDFNEEVLFDLDEAELFEGGVFLPEEDLFVERNAIRTSFGSGAGLSYQLSPQTALNLDANGYVLRYSDDGDGRLVDSSGYGMRLGWDRDLGDTRSVGFGVSMQRYDADNPEQTQSMTYVAGLRYAQSLTRMTSLRLGFGGSMTETTRNFSDQPGPTTDRDFGFNGNIDLTFRREDALIGVSLVQAVRPTSTGTVRNVTAFSGTVSYRVNTRMSLGLTARVSVQQALSGDSSGDDSDRGLFLSPTVNYRLNRDWTGQLGYSLRLNDDDRGTAISNKLFLGATRSLEFFP